MNKTDFPNVVLDQILKTKQYFKVVSLKIKNKKLSENIFGKNILVKTQL